MDWFITGHLKVEVDPITDTKNTHTVHIKMYTRRVGHTYTVDMALNSKAC